MSAQLCQLVDAAQKFNEENLSAQLAKDEEKEIRSPEGSPTPINISSWTLSSSI